MVSKHVYHQMAFIFNLSGFALDTSYLIRMRMRERSTRVKAFLKHIPKLLKFARVVIKSAIAVR